MIIINDYVKTKVNQEEYIYINTLNGGIDIIEAEADDVLEKWKKYGIRCETSYDKDIYDFMIQRGYILDEDRAKKIKEDMYIRLRKEMKYRQENIESITLALTYDCNFNCFYCYENDNSEFSEIMPKTMTKEMVDRIYKMYGNKLKSVGLFGGEPLLLKNFELVEYILNKRDDLSYHIITNGYYLEEFIPILKDKKIKYIQVTVDGPKEKHDKRRTLLDTSPTFEKIMRGISKSLDNGIPIKIRMNVDDSNYHEAIRFREVLMNRYRNHEKILSFEVSSLFQSDCVKKFEFFQKMYEKDVKPGENNKANMRKNEILYKALPIINFFLGEDKYKPKYVFCDANLGRRIFDPNGDIYTCTLALGKRELALGKYYPEYKLDHKENWLNRTIEEIEGCRECSKALLCGGGCPLFAYNRTGSFNNIACYQTKLCLEKILPIVYDKYKK